MERSCLFRCSLCILVLLFTEVISVAPPRKVHFDGQQKSVFIDSGESPLQHGDSAAQTKVCTPENDVARCDLSSDDQLAMDRRSVSLELDTNFTLKDPQLSRLVTDMTHRILQSAM